MSTVRDIFVILLATLAILSVPWGAIALVAGLNGSIVDAEYSLNVKVGMLLFVFGMLPPAALGIWLRLWRKCA